MQTLLRACVSGAVAWPLMDLTLRTLYAREAPRARRREDAARAGVPAMEVLAVKVARPFGVELGRLQRRRAGKVVQWVVGVGSALLFIPARRYLPVRRGLRRGLLFGAALWLGLDEVLTRVLRLAPSPRAFPRPTHARGLVGHLVYGAAIEATWNLLARRGDANAAES